MKPLLDVYDLHVTFFGLRREPIPAVRGVTFEIERGDTVGLVGESGSGKSVTAHALVGLLSRSQCRMEGEIRFGGLNLVNLPEKRFQPLRGKKIAMVFQETVASLNPTMKIGRQVAEAIGPRANKGAVIDLLTRVGIPRPDHRYYQFPHQLSGGMCQRVSLALALASRPELLIADEPTTALDPTLQRQVLELLKAVQEETGMALLLITHDIGLVAGYCNRILVMYAGQIVEKGPTDAILTAAKHPYTQGLLASLPSLDGKAVLRAIPGGSPDLRYVRPGCAFSPRCPHALRICELYRPPLDQVGPGQRAACWLHDPRAKGK
jgi:oligopeptide transport system ATP-binding protein